MLVSFVIPTYNSSEKITRAIQSIVSCGVDYEIIIVDDCSDDFSKLKAIVADFNNIRIISKETKTNASVSRNIGIKNTLGDVIFLLDSDDYINNDYILRRLELHKVNNFIYGAFFVVSNIKSNLVQRSPGSINDKKPECFLFSEELGDFRTSTISFSSSIKESVIFDELQRKHQDWGLLFRVLQNNIIVYHDAVPGVTIDERGNKRMSAKMDMPASQYFIDIYLSNAEYKYKNRFLKLLLGASIRIGDFHDCKQIVKMYKLGTGRTLLDVFSILINLGILNKLTFNLLKKMVFIFL